MPERKKIGTFTISEPREVTQHYEFAAWYRRHMLTPGTYDLVMGNVWALAEIPSVITGSSFGAYFGGVCYVPKVDEEVGEAATYWMQFDTHHIASAVMAHRADPSIPCPFTLLPDYEIEQIGTYSTGEPMYCIKNL